MLGFINEDTEAQRRFATCQKQQSSKGWRQDVLWVGLTLNPRLFGHETLLGGRGHFLLGVLPENNSPADAWTFPVLHHEISCQKHILNYFGPTSCRLHFKIIRVGYLRTLAKGSKVAVPMRKGPVWDKKSHEWRIP